MIASIGPLGHCRVESIPLVEIGMTGIETLAMSVRY